MLQTAEVPIDAGTKIGEYQVVRPIAEGGMGAVYEAVHPVIGKRAAIKVIKAHMLDRHDAIERFIREASTVNTIRHPSIVDVFAFGSLEDGRPYYIMDFLEGESLETRLRRHKRLTLAEAMPLFRQVAAALDAAHAVGVVHRDLKPDNVFLAVRGRDDSHVRVLDFGIAKLTTPGSSNTQTGTVLGTPHYMSPEQCRGQSVDHRSDVYSFGILVYRTLVGRPPFDGDSMMTLMFQHVTAPPPPPSTVGLPATLDPILARALAKSPADRYPRLEAIVDDLESAMAVATTVQSPAPTPVAELAESVADPVADDTNAPEESASGSLDAGSVPTSVEDGSDMDLVGVTVANGGPEEVASQDWMAHDGGVQRLLFSPDGRTLASAGSDQTVKLWDRMGRSVWVVDTRGLTVTQLAFSPDGGWLAAAGLEGKIRLWRTRDRSELRELPGRHEGAVNDLVFSHDGGLLISAGRDRCVRVHDLRTEESRALRGHRLGVMAVAVSRDGCIASASYDETVRLWNDKKGGRRTLECGAAVHALAFRPGGRHLVASDAVGIIYEWEVDLALRREKPPCRLRRGHDGQVCSLAYSADGELLASAGSDGTARVWPLDGRRPAILSHGAKVRQVEFTPNDRYLVTSCLDSTARLWDLSDHSCTTIVSLDGPASFGSVSADSRLMASSSAKSPRVTLRVIPEVCPGEDLETEIRTVAPQAKRPSPRPRRARMKSESGVGKVLRILGITGPK